MQYLLNQDEYREYQRLQKQNDSNTKLLWNSDMEKSTEAIINELVSDLDSSTCHPETIDALKVACWDIYGLMIR